MKKPCLKALIVGELGWRHSVRDFCIHQAVYTTAVVTFVHNS